MSVMAFELPIMEMAFATVFTLAIDFQFRIVTFGNRFLKFNGHSRPPYYIVRLFSRVFQI